MNENISTIQIVKREDSSNIQIVKREDSSKLPRFLGVPRQDDITESGSLVGMIGGRSVSKVVEKDTQELDQAGFSWDEGITILKRISLAILYCEEHDIATKLPGFPELKFKLTGATFQFSNLVKSAALQGEGDHSDTLATKSPEARISFCNEKESSIIVNAQTLFLAEAYHILEKGNPYEMNGDQLVQLIRGFNQNEFEKVQEWVDSHIQEGALIGHHERILLSDGTTISLEVMNGNTLWVHFLDKDKRLFRLQVKPSKSTRKTIGAIVISKQQKNHKYNEADSVEFSYNNNEELSRVEIVSDNEGGVPVNLKPVSFVDMQSRFAEYINLSEKLHRRSLVQRGGLLDGLDEELIKLVTCEIYDKIADLDEMTDQYDEW